MLPKWSIFIFTLILSVILTPLINVEPAQANINITKKEQDQVKLIQQTIQEARHGKSIDAPFIIGKSTQSDIHSIWGKPETSFVSARVDFYTIRKFVFSYHYDTIWSLSTIRNEDHKYQKISISTLIRTLGHPEYSSIEGNKKWFVYSDRS